MHLVLELKANLIVYTKSLNSFYDNITKVCTILVWYYIEGANQENESGFVYKRRIARLDWNYKEWYQTKSDLLNQGNSLQFDATVKKSANSAKKQKNKTTLLLQFYNSFNFIL